VHYCCKILRVICFRLVKIYDAMDPVAKHCRQTDNLNGYATVIHRAIEVSIHGFPFEQNPQHLTIDVILTCGNSIISNVGRTIRRLALLSLIGGSGFCRLTRTREAVSALGESVDITLVRLPTSFC